MVGTGRDQEHRGDTISPSHGINPLDRLSGVHRRERGYSHIPDAQFSSWELHESGADEHSHA